jgi:NAD(P)-dependent dehydrogenase (short-subunit alcohol dehydrogenase family)
VCAEPFTARHFFYASLCPPCAAFNLARRTQTADLTGRVALVTGARVTSGYATALKLLRAGATVIGTTRFPRDAAARLAAEPDFADWSRRVHLFGLDFRAPGWVEAFADHVAATFGRLHILVNNAAQTVRRPAPFHAHLVPAERAPVSEVARPLRPLLAAGQRLAERVAGPGAAGREITGLAALFSQARVLPEDVSLLEARGEVGEAIDLRTRNSWVLGLGEVASAEALEALLVNAAAPFILTGRLRELMAREALADKWVINVTAVEGQYSRRHKDGRHPHLDMAKAALNMLTRASADDYARDRIFMNSVDVGWFSNGEPAEVAAAMRARGFTLPLDEIDAAARVCDPIFSGVRTGANRHGQLLKNYAPTGW